MDVLDAHFCIVNTMFQSDVESGNDVRPEQHMHDAVCHNSEVMSSTTILVEGARLGVDEAEIPMIKKKACVTRMASARRTKCSGREEKEQTCKHFRT